jgi:hypothetical protein
VADSRPIRHLLYNWRIDHLLPSVQKEKCVIQTRSAQTPVCVKYLLRQIGKHRPLDREVRYPNFRAVFPGAEP